MIARELESELHTLLGEFPIVTVLGPRQAGKTTLVRAALQDYQYVSLEDPEMRLLAGEDPKALLARYGGKTIFDEIQRAPHLLSYLQGTVDEEKTNGRYVLTGSHQLELRQAVAQSLAGRTGILNLLPFSIGELAAAGIQFETFEEYAFQGFMPRIYDEKQRPGAAYSSYYQTYVERDVRQLIQLKNVALFEKFIKLVAGRVGQLMDYQSLGNDAGVDAKTIKHWFSILEASYILFKLPPYYENFGKRVIKSPKYYFTDTGLLCHLLGIEHPAQITRDPLVGAIFENLVLLECLKARYNQGKQANLYFFRDSNGQELDILHAAGRTLVGIEIKSAATYHPAFKKSLTSFHAKLAPLAGRYVVYNGQSLAFSDGVQALHFNEVARIFHA